MSDKRIDRLNRELGLALGFCGDHPRFAWMYAPELHYFIRSGERYERFCWADRIGKVWLLAQWRVPPMSESDWILSFGKQFPYPAKGHYYAHTETAFRPGLTPDENDTAQVIRRLTEQMAEKFDAHYRRSKADADAGQEQARKDFYDEVDGFWPAFGNFEWGKKRHVSFGGI